MFVDFFVDWFLFVGFCVDWFFFDGFFVDWFFFDGFLFNLFCGVVIILIFFVDGFNSFDGDGIWLEGVVFGLCLVGDLIDGVFIFVVCLGCVGVFCIGGFGVNWFIVFLGIFLIVFFLEFNRFFW